MIEKVVLIKTLKAGKNVWEEGKILEAPLPPDILNEIRAKTGIVKVIQGDDIAQTKLVFVAERVKETASSMTTMAIEPDPVSKPKPKLLRRRG